MREKRSSQSGKQFSALDHLDAFHCKYTIIYTGYSLINVTVEV
jgi:hypothetical protein